MCQRLLAGSAAASAGNEAAIRQMAAEQKRMKIPTALLPRCPVCSGPMTMNLRSDNRFVEDAGWHAASDRYGSFEIYDPRVMDATIEHAKEHSPRSWKKAATVIQEALEQGTDGVWKADTMEEIADLAGIEKQRLLQTFHDYNRYCEQGRDDEFSKDPKRLWKLTGPFYCTRYTEPNYICTLDGVHTGQDSEVLDANHQEIPGLYAAGTLGTELWPGYCTYGMPGGTNAFNVDSARRAVAHAAKTNKFKKPSM